VAVEEEAASMVAVDSVVEVLVADTSVLPWAVSTAVGSVVADMS
jgi:hypothetical protein